MKNKFISMLMAVLMSFSMVTSAFAADFKDVPESHKNYEAIETLEVLDLVAGYDNKNFGPEDVLSRAQLCTMMVRAIYGDDIHYSANNAFTDVPVTHWAREFVDTAYRAGLMVGYGNGIFGQRRQCSIQLTFQHTQVCLHIVVLFLGSSPIA